MSRDLTPREMLGLEKYNMSRGVSSLFEMMRGTSWVINGVAKPMYTPEEMTIREQYPMLGKLCENFAQLHAELSKIPGGLDLLKKRDEELTAYVTTGAGDKESYLIRWFNGDLDGHFHYSETNNELFLHSFLADAREVYLTARKCVVQEEPSDDLALPWFDPSKLTDRSSLRLCFDQENDQNMVCVDLCYDSAPSLPACDVECVFVAPAERVNIQQARWYLHELAEKLKIPAYDESKPALIQFPVKVAWSNLGEGIRGDYDPNDPHDVNLLRFDVFVYRDGIWEAKDDGSLCSSFPANSSPADQEQGLHILMDNFYGILSKDVEASIKKCAERMSHLGVDYFRPQILPKSSLRIKAPLTEQIQSADERPRNSSEHNPSRGNPDRDGRT